MAAGRPAHELTGQRAAAPAPRVLLVDDHASIRDALGELLGDAGVVVVGEAADGEQAVALAHDLRPEVVVMDVSMPVLDGLEATRRITRADPDIGVVIFTAFAGEELTVAALAAGARTVVWKGPIQQLIQAVFAVSRSPGPAG